MISRKVYRECFHNCVLGLISLLFTIRTYLNFSINIISFLRAAGTYLQKKYLPVVCYCIKNIQKIQYVFKAYIYCFSPHNSYQQTVCGKIFTQKYTCRYFIKTLFLILVHNMMLIIFLPSLTHLLNSSVSSAIKYEHLIPKKQFH